MFLIPSRLTCQGKQTIDKAAAARFITHAIPVAQRIAPTAAAQARDQAIAAMDVDEDVGMSTRFRHVAAASSADTNMDDEAEALLEGVLEASLAAGEISEGNGTDGTATPPATVPSPAAKVTAKKDKAEKGDKIKKSKKAKAGGKSAKAKVGKGTK